MKLAGKIIAGVVVLVVVGGVLLLRPDHRERDAAEATRLALRKQGVKTDLADFNFTLSPEARARAAILNRAGPDRPRSSGSDYPARLPLLQGGPDLMQPVNSNTALVVWREMILPNFSLAPWLTTMDPEQTRDLWPPLHDLLEAEKAVLDPACEVAISGPIRFGFAPTNGRVMFPHVAGLRYLVQTLGTRAVFELYQDNPAAAWTNLLAATRLVTAWEPEPCDFSYIVRFGCATAVFEATWQALQFDGWTDEQLLRLQQEWTSADFIHGLPQTEEFALASDRDLFEKDRHSRLDVGVPLRFAIRYARNAAGSLRGYWRRVQYRSHGSYEDEKGIMLSHRERQLEWEKAVRAETWSEMRALPGITNRVPYLSPYSNTVVTPVSATRFAARAHDALGTLPAQAAIPEARRRLIITALALERFHLHHHRYPETLFELSPEYLAKVPLDFMDGKPLRYQVTADGHFVLYSVGLDCVDDGGQMRPDSGTNPYRARMRLGTVLAGDLVWPRPASPMEAKNYIAGERKAQAQRIAQARAALEEQERLAEESRVQTVRDLLSQKSLSRAAEPEVNGTPLYKLLRDPRIAPGKDMTLDDLLTVRQVITGEEPDIATFEIPASYEAVTNVGLLELLVDDDTADLSKSDGSEMIPVRRSTNGTCLLVWNTGADAPGLHAVQAQLSYEDGPRRTRRSMEIKGPAVPFYSSNLCQFVVEQCSLNRTGAVLYAKLPESNGVYQVELKAMNGGHLKTIAGQTTNGVIEVKWNLIDDAGRRYVDQALDSVFHVTLPASGRSITQRGP